MDTKKGMRGPGAATHTGTPGRSAEPTGRTETETPFAFYLLMGALVAALLYVAGMALSI